MVTASFKEGQKTAITTSLQKYDYGEVLRIKGLSLPRYVAVQFAVDGMSEALPSSIGETVEDVTDVLIPNSLLRSNIKPWNYNIMAYVYIVSGSSGKTEYTITIPVKWRPKTGDDQAADDDVAAVIGSAVEKMNTATTKAENAANQASATAEEIKADREKITEISGLKSDLSDFKDLADFADSNADSKDTLYIVDTNGKIIAKISKDGIDTVGYKKHGEDFVPGSVDVLETYDDVFYIADGNGNVIFKASKDGIEGVNISASSPSPYKDKVLISIGDSLSAHDKWQKWLVEWWGCTFDDDANVNGKDGHSPMAKGGTAVIPNSVDSIYIRALDAHYYNPDVIILYAGQNDVPHFGSATEVNSSAVGTIDDVPYKKTVPYTELEESEYSDYTSWYEGRPTLYSYCMGLIENLLTSCPKAQIIVLTPMQMWTSDGTQSVGRKQLVTTWHNICDKYALPIVDLWNKSGVNVFNMIEYYPNAGNVHPNDYGYKHIAETIYSEM